jgi:hypothetical protein
VADEEGWDATLCQAEAVLAAHAQHTAGEWDWAMPAAGAEACLGKGGVAAGRVAALQAATDSDQPAMVAQGGKRVREGKKAAEVECNPNQTHV